MKILIFIMLFWTLNLSGQSYERFEAYTISQINLYRKDITEYYHYFELLFEKRDTAYLREKISNPDFDKIYLVEGYNFKTNKYSILEAYENKSMTSDPLHPNEFYIDRKKQRFCSYNFLSDTLIIENDGSQVDTIFPRKYRYGAGCVISKETKKIFKRLRRKAKADGIVIETYCRVETVIDKKTNKILVTYLYPVLGKRECDLSVGMYSDYPAGIDFWLFTSPCIVDN